MSPTAACRFARQPDFLSDTQFTVQKHIDVRQFLLFNLIYLVFALSFVYGLFSDDDHVYLMHACLFSLIGNPVCSTALSNTNYCQLQQQTRQPYSTSLANCGGKSCPPDQKLSPQSCECAYPYGGMLYFRGPLFRELSNVNIFHSLEMSLWVKLGLTPGSVSLQNPFFNSDDYLQVQLALFPPTGQYFNRSEVQRIGFALSNQTYKPPHEFGPYYFIAFPYTFPGNIETQYTCTLTIATSIQLVTVIYIYY